MLVFRLFIAKQANLLGITVKNQLIGSHKNFVDSLLKV